MVGVSGEVNPLPPAKNVTAEARCKALSRLPAHAIFVHRFQSPVEMPQGDAKLNLRAP